MTDDTRPPPGCPPDAEHFMPDQAQTAAPQVSGTIGYAVAQPERAR